MCNWITGKYTVRTNPAIITKSYYIILLYITVFYKQSFSPFVSFIYIYQIVTDLLLLEVAKNNLSNVEKPEQLGIYFNLFNDRFVPTKCGTK